MSEVMEWVGSLLDDESLERRQGERRVIRRLTQDRRSETVAVPDEVEDA